MHTDNPHPLTLSCGASIITDVLPQPSIGPITEAVQHWVFSQAVYEAHELYEGDKGLNASESYLIDSTVYCGKTFRSTR